MPLKIARYRNAHLKRITPRRHKHYKLEIKRVLKANRKFIDSYLRTSGILRRETMDLLYAVRADTLNTHTLEYVKVLANEMNDLENYHCSPKLRFKRAILRRVSTMVLNADDIK